MLWVCVLWKFNLALLLLKLQLPSFLLLIGSLHFTFESSQKGRRLLVDQASLFDVVDKGIVRIKNTLFQNSFGLGLANDLVDAFAKLGVFGLEGLEGFFECVGETLLAETTFLGMKSISFPAKIEFEKKTVRSWRIKEPKNNPYQYVVLTVSFPSRLLHWQEWTMFVWTCQRVGVSWHWLP